MLQRRTTGGCSTSRRRSSRGSQTSRRPNQSFTDRKIEIRAKDGKGERTGAVQQSTPYATFPAIMKAIQPALTKNGLRLSFSTTPMEPIIVGDSFIERITTRMASKLWPDEQWSDDRWDDKH